jgi:hypothetical protein
VSQWDITSRGEDNDILKMAKFRFPHSSAPLNIRGIMSRESTHKNIYALEQIVLKLTLWISPVIREPEMNFAFV